MEPATLRAVLHEAVGKEKEGRYGVPERKGVSVHLSRQAGGLVLQKVTAFRLGEAFVRIDTDRGEVFYVSFEDVRAVVATEKKKKAGFV